MFEQIGNGNVAVPTHVFKIIVGEGTGGELKAIAFIAVNKKPASGWKFSQGIVAIDWLEVALHCRETAVGLHLAIGSSFGAVLGALTLQQT